MANYGYWTSSRASTCLNLVVGILMVSGCGGSPDGPTLATVKGKITYQGKPLTVGQISFIPDSSKGTAGPMASGRVNENGEFQLQTFKPGDGAIVGSHKVVISSYKEVAFDPDAPNVSLESVSYIPVKYADDKTSGLVAEVKKSAADNVFQFELK